MAIKKCPKCAEKIQKKALVCKHCGHEFPKEKTFAEKMDEFNAKVAKEEEEKMSKMSKKEREVYKEKRQKQDKIITWVVLGIIAFVIIFLFKSCAGIFSGGGSSSSSSSYVSTVSASTLVQAFESSESTAKSKYNKVIVSGTIYSITDSVLSSVDVSLETNDPYAFVKGNVTNSYDASLLDTGDYVKLECSNARWDTFEVNVLLSNCKVK